MDYVLSFNFIGCASFYLVTFIFKFGFTWTVDVFYPFHAD